MAEKKQAKAKNMSGGNHSWGGAYFLGMIGAAIYYIQQSDTFWGIVLALLKALVWPAFLVYHLLKLAG